MTATTSTGLRLLIYTHTAQPRGQYSERSIQLARGGRVETGVMAVPARRLLPPNDDNSNLYAEGGHRYSHLFILSDRKRTYLQYRKSTSKLPAIRFLHQDPRLTFCDGSARYSLGPTRALHDPRLPHSRHFNS